MRDGQFRNFASHNQQYKLKAEHELNLGRLLLEKEVAGKENIIISTIVRVGLIHTSGYYSVLMIDDSESCTRIFQKESSIFF
jgi:hypothetical protein